MTTFQEDLLGQLSKVARLAKRDIDAALLPFSLHTGQWGLIKAVAILEPVSQVALSKYLVIEKPAVTKTVARLEELGYITRTGSGRKRLITLTPSARHAYREIDQAVQSAHHAFLQSVSFDDQSIIAAVMTQLLATHRPDEQEDSL
ncbi:MULTISPECIES: MarR family winged helix-turn-helix transcriptional regulator [Exiguobacterium]|uniref:Transcriptional regulator, MarR family n=1 Tax=Exiguobacterium sibiricum (strain DSM 17290 / CCUG 55495 / CIP 109462 / JCM 13490 / 255-15) TaxID=262543 RepID=B1YJZ3_EXIS2|nr:MULTISPECIES: MarR family transcriptional regulator [Exiguobacterium]ACB61631.1 transcriptional regulator, MarR family [Exiguobacterium sibiricum 255-15]MCT4792295.1 MarR family transcriptional regulator [Exiguobacterium artemiae]MDX1258289.1 MarR family transcriptional regulator [Exiguobacterium sp. K1]